MILYNFSSIADISEASKLRRETIKNNILGISNILEAMIKSNINKIIYSSTMYVYSDKGSFYTASKQAAESLIDVYSKSFNIDYTLLRFGSIYGPRSQKWNGIRKFVSEAINKGSLTYSGTGEEVRDYINVIDAAELSVKALDEKYKNKAITVTGQQSMRVKDLFKIIFEILGVEGKVKYLKDHDNKDHYGFTPYKYNPKPAKKIVPSEFIDIGQGILELIDEIKQSK